MDHVMINLPIEKIGQDEDMYPDRHRFSVVEARYVKHAMEIDNPDLCALPKHFTITRLISLSTISLPGYDYNDVQHMSIAERKESVLSLQKVFSPLAHIADMASAVNEALVSSYLSREVKINASRTAINSFRSGVGGRALSFVVYGLTGDGKTVAINLIRRMYPTAMHHTIENTEYIQIPTVMVTALVGNMTEIMIAIAKYIDNVLGNGPIWEQRLKKNNLGLSASVIKEAIQTYHIGLIIIDESQFLRFDGSNSSLENLVGIAEETGCALGFIGNKELIPKMDNYPRFVSRTMFNRIEVKPTEEVSRKFFEQAIRHLWQYQWTKEYTELTDEIMDELIKGSMYNICILKSLLMRIQSEAISKYPKGGITPQYIRKISEKKFTVIRQLILDGSEESEKLVLKLLKENVDEIKNDSKCMKAKAAIKAMEERKAIDETWGTGRYEELEKAVKGFGLNSGNLKKIVNKMIIQDPGLPNRDIAVVADEIKEYMEEHQKDIYQQARHHKKEVDMEQEKLVREAMKDALGDITNGV